MRLLFAVVVIGICGCDASSTQRSVPSPASPSGPSRAETRSDPLVQAAATDANLLKGNDRRPLLQIDEIEFTSPAIKEAVRRFTAAAEGCAGTGWYRSGYRETHSGGESGAYREIDAIWCTEATPQGTPRYSADHHYGLDVRPFHYIWLSLEGGYSPPRTICSLKLLADWLDETGTGWVTRLHFRGDIGKEGRFVGRYLTTTFDRTGFGQIPLKRGDPIFDDLSERHSLILGITSITTTSRLDNLRFDTRLSVGRGSAHGPGRADGDINDYAISLLQSEDGFRKTALAELDELETACRAKIPSGELIVSVMRREGDGRDGISPWGDDRDRMLSEFPEQERQAIFRVMLAEIERRKTLVNEHSRELYEGVSKAFPLLECLKASENGAAEPK